MSHADSDHYNGLLDLLDRFAIGEILVPPGFEGPRNPGAGTLLDAARARGVAVREVVAGERRGSAGARFSILHPPESWDRGASDNARCLVLDVESSGRHVLLTGDLEQEGLRELVRRPVPAPALDAILAPHHGGRTANPDWLYSWAGPAMVVVSQRPPSAGSRDALAALDDRGIPVLRTWRRGAIGLRWTPEGVVARGFLDDPPPSDPSRISNLRSEISNLRFEIPNCILTHINFSKGWLTGLVAATGLLAGLGACAGLAVVEWGAWALVAPGRRLRADDEGGDPAPGEPIAAVAADGTRLAGTWHAASGSTSTGGPVILVHGFADAPSALRGRVEFLTRLGRDVARIDLRGYGRSGGAWASFGGREAGDLRAWIDALADRMGPSQAPVLWGRSMGSAIAVRAAAEDARVAALVLESPLVDLEAAIAGWLRRARVPLPRAFARMIAARAGSLSGVPLTRPPPDRPRAPRRRAGPDRPRGARHARPPRPTPDAWPTPSPAPRSSSKSPGAGHADAFESGGPDLLDRVAAFLADPASLPGQATGRAESQIRDLEI